MIRKDFECFNNKCEFSINILDATWYLRSAWRRVKHTTIRSCFRHGEFEKLKETIEEEQNEEKTTLVVEEVVKRSIVSTDSFEECGKTDDKVLMFDVTIDKDIVKES